jgi:hypothetical protein
MQRIFQDIEFSKMMKRHMVDIISLLLDRGEFFSILTNIERVEFNPPLPPHILSSFKPITLFAIAEYTFESSELSEETLTFEAGFGAENIGSVVTVPLGSIVQILLEETPIYINLSLEQPENRRDRDKDIEKSTNIFLSNPENKDLLK